MNTENEYKLSEYYKIASKYDEFIMDGFITVLDSNYLKLSDKGEDVLNKCHESIRMMKECSEDDYKTKYAISSVVVIYI